MKLTQSGCMGEDCPRPGDDQELVDACLRAFDGAVAARLRLAIDPVSRRAVGEGIERVAPRPLPPEAAAQLLGERGRFGADGTLLLESPLLRSGSWLRLDRRDIDWRTVAPGVVEVGFRIHNDGTRASEPTIAEVRSAPFGAHRDWSPLKVVEVPSVPAGGSLRVSLRATHAAAEGATAEGEPRPVAGQGAPGSADRPASLVAAAAAWARALLRRLAAAWVGPRPGAAVEAGARSGSRAQPEARGAEFTPSVGEHVRLVPSSPVGLDATPGPPRYWVGNIEVRVLDARARGEDLRVERHVAGGRLVRPGQANHALIEIGSSSAWRKAEFYTLEARILDGDGRRLTPKEAARWSWRLQACDGTRGYGDRARMLCNNGTPFELELTPPADAGRCRFELHVTQEFTGAVAVVELELEMER